MLKPFPRHSTELSIYRIFVGRTLGESYLFSDFGGCFIFEGMDILILDKKRVEFSIRTLHDLGSRVFKDISSYTYIVDILLNKRNTSIISGIEVYENMVPLPNLHGFSLKINTDGVLLEVYTVPKWEEVAGMRRPSTVEKNILYS